MQGRLLHLQICIEGLVVNLINVYAPTSGPERLQFYQQASAFLGTLVSHECLVLGGDFNTTLEERDCSGTEQNPAAADTLRETVEYHSLVDIWRDHHPDDTSTFTFVRVKAHRVLWEELPTVSVSDQDWLELPLTLAEFSEALCRMPTNKSPGMDGLTVEFYRVFWDVLGPDLVTAWAESLQSGILSLSCSTDYKIVAKAISLRLGSVLADVIHPDQTYTIPDCSIFDNVFMVRDLLELRRRDGLSFTLLSLDQEKAFDRVDHGYLLSTLQAFGFGPQFVGFLLVLYASKECLVKLNWTLTEPVSFGQGVRQGCPLSGQLYTLAIEPFLCLLRRRLTWLVLREPELQLVLSAYADDVLLVIQDPGDLARVEACQAIYSAASSARVNWVKSSGLAGMRKDDLANQGWQRQDKINLSNDLLTAVPMTSLISVGLLFILK
ncbi:unnamed protein product [Caretta caretta]